MACRKHHCDGNRHTWKAIARSTADLGRAIAARVRSRGTWEVDGSIWRRRSTAIARLVAFLACAHRAVPGCLSQCTRLHTALSRYGSRGMPAGGLWHSRISARGCTQAIFRCLHRIKGNHGSMKIIAAAPKCALAPLRLSSPAEMRTLLRRPARPLPHAAAQLTRKPLLACYQPRPASYSRREARPGCLAVPRLFCSCRSCGWRGSHLW